MKASELTETVGMEELRTALQEERDDFLVGVIAGERNPHWNIQPVVARYQGTWCKIQNEGNELIAFGHNFTENGQQKFQYLTERFAFGEFFRVDRFQQHNRPLDGIPYFAFGNGTSRLRSNFIDIVEGTVDFSRATFEPSDNNGMLKYIRSLLDAGREFHFYAKPLDGDELGMLGPFTVNATGLTGHRLNIRAIISNADTIWRFGAISTDMALSYECTLEDGTPLLRTAVWDWLPTSIGSAKKFLDDAKLVSWVSQKVASAPTKPANFEEALRSLSKALKERDIDPSEKDLQRRVLYLLDTVEANSANFDALLEAIPQTKTARAKIEQLEVTIQQAQQEIDQQNAALEKLRSAADEERLRLDEIVAKRNMQEKQAQEYDRLKLEDLRGELEEVNACITAKRQELEGLKEFESFTEALESLRKDKTRLEIEKDILASQRSELQEQLNHLQEDFRKEQKAAATQLRDLIKSKTHFDFISGRDLQSYDDRKPKVVDTRTAPVDLGNSDETTQERRFLQLVQKRLSQMGRVYPAHFVANLLVSIHQNMFTILAGPPGTGKTSLARLISRFLAGPNRVVEVPVGRGWTTQRDLVGFVNPLSNTFHQAQTAVYPLLRQLEGEYLQGWSTASPLVYVVLDEANLSPIEHYWSTFYNLTDSLCESERVSLELGARQTLDLPCSFRFLGTINNDITTEPLSPRVLDRVNIIRLPDSVQEDLSPSTPYEGGDIIGTGGLPFEQAIALLGPDTAKPASPIGAAITSSEKALRNLGELLQRVGLKPSPRVYLAMRHFCFRASRYMTEEYRPLDYFIAQRMLPRIAIQGAEAKARLQDLSQGLHQILQLDDSLSVSVLDRIIAVGDSHGSYENYNYFMAW